jgi:hypothetical protein
MMDTYKQVGGIVDSLHRYSARAQFGSQGLEERRPCECSYISEFCCSAGEDYGDIGTAVVVYYSVFVQAAATALGYTSSFVKCRNCSCHASQSSKEHLVQLHGEIWSVKRVK